MARRYHQHAFPFMRRLIVLFLLFLVACSASAFDPTLMLPDPKLTPGKIAAAAKDQHGVTEEMERQVLSEYSIPWTRRSEFKIDHLIPKELGGADDLANLWPQSLSAKPYSPRRK